MNQELIGKMFKNVIEFRTVFDLPIGEDFTPELHESLTVEELVELCDAENLIDVADAIIDICYVVVGRAVNKVLKEYSNEYYLLGLMMKVAEKKGIPFERCWNEVHSSNMSKACESLELARDTRDKYKLENIEVEIFSVGGLYLVKCERDPTGDIKKGKVLKSVNYTPANLSFVVE